jgi:uncharacterized protein (DUF488 family)
MGAIHLFTIGFTGKTAEEFFSRLRTAGVRRIVDVRLNNTSQLAGFSKRDDLAYFLREILGAEYVHFPVLAPTQEILDAYKKGKGSWSAYEQGFLELMRERRVEECAGKDVLHLGCLLCSEHEPDLCHRRLVAEYLRDNWGDVEITHIV